MVCKRWWLSSISFFFLASAAAQTLCFDDKGNYTTNSTYSRNLGSLLSSLSTKVDDFGFYNASMGQNNDTVYANVLCRGDDQLDKCRGCIRNATSEILSSCPNYKQAVRWEDVCRLRYSDEPMFGILNDGPRFPVIRNTQNASRPDQFMRDLRALQLNLREQASSGGSLLKVAAGNTTSADLQNIYSLVQCIPDLSTADCSNCLIAAAAAITSQCDGKISCFIRKPSCNINYDIVPFYNETRLQEVQALITPPLQPLPGKKGDKRTRTIVIVVVAIVACLTLAMCAGILFIKKRRKKHEEELDSVPEINVAESLQYDFSEIKAATDDFSEANKLGQGGFGAVYKGILPNGLGIAVKRLSADSGQGDIEFKNEVLLVAQLQHRNLVRLLGFSMQGKERLLIYEFLQNTSLDRFIFDPIKRNDLDCEKRYKIIVGISRGLLYLHEESRLKIIHRDLKASNILLDGDMNSKIADFGMARLFVADETQGSTNRIVGTYGYMSPEYAMRGHFSVKSDVFSFGVLVLEIVTGQKNHSFRIEENIEDLLSVAWKCWRQGTIEEMIDPVLRAGSGSLRDMLRCIHIGLLCVQDNPADRPTMASVVLMLSSYTISLPVPAEPTFPAASNFRSRNAFIQALDSRDFESSKSSSKNAVSMSEFYPR